MRQPEIVPPRLASFLKQPSRSWLFERVVAYTMFLCLRPKSEWRRLIPAKWRKRFPRLDVQVYRFFKVVCVFAHGFSKVSA
jgi:hypothetical protein